MGTPNKVPIRGACLLYMTRVDCICMQLYFEQINVLPCMSLELSKRFTKTELCLPSRYIEFLIYVLFKEYIYSDYIDIYSTINVKRILHVFNNIFDKKSNVGMNFFDVI